MRPLRLGEVLDASIQLVRRNFRTLAIIVLIVGLPVAVVELLVTTSTTEPCTDEICRKGASIYYTDKDTYAAGVIANALLQIVQTVLVTVGCFEVLTSSYLGRRVGVRSSLRFAARRAHSVLWISLLVGLGVLFSAVALILPAIWLGVLWSLALPALLVEGTRGREALGRSRGLVKGRWWPTLGTLLVGIIITVVPVTLLGTALGVVEVTDVLHPGSVSALGITQALGLAISVFTRPFLGAVTVLLYFDLRVRKEGFDLQMLASQLGGDSVLPARYDE